MPNDHTITPIVELAGEFGSASVANECRTLTQAFPQASPNLCLRLMQILIVEALSNSPLRFISILPPGNSVGRTNIKTLSKSSTSALGISLLPFDYRTLCRNVYRTCLFAHLGKTYMLRTSKLLFKYLPNFSNFFSNLESR